MKKLLAFTAVAEAGTGLALMIVPSVVTRLLFGVQLSDGVVAVARVAGIALVSLGVACWPGQTATPAALRGMTTYSLLAALYLAYVAVHGEWVGVLLWPAVVLHAILSLLLGRAWYATRTVSGSRHEPLDRSSKPDR